MKMKLKMPSFVNKLIKKLKFMTKTNNLNKVLMLVGVLLGLFFIHRFYLSKEGFEGNASDLDSALSNNDKKTMIFFSADWCGHCKNFKPVWDKLTTPENKSKANFINVNCSDNEDEKIQEIMTKYSVQGFPTLMIHDPSNSENSLTEYTDDRSVDKIMSSLS